MNEESLSYLQPKFKSRGSADLTEKLDNLSGSNLESTAINSCDSISNSIADKVSRTNESSKTNAYSETSAATGISESVTVEIKLTFNSSSSPTFVPNPGTLADLKKQRSDTRNNSVGSNGSSNKITVGSTSSSSPQDLTANVSRKNGRRITVTYDPPPSPTVNVPKFRSASGEIVGGEETVKRGCCALM